MSSGPARTSWDSAETQLLPSQVSASDFGRLFDTTLPAVPNETTNQDYAQPIIADHVLIAVTEENEVVGLDPQSGKVLWKDDPLGPSWPASTVNCGDLVPDIGITSTPVYDAATQTLYVMAKQNDGKDVEHPNFKLHALDPTTGHELSGWPVTISGTPTDGQAAFDAQTASQRPGLMVLGGSVYAGFASHCDHKPYVGYISGVNEKTRVQTLWAAESGNADSEAGIWQSGGALASDGANQIITVTGNGVSPTTGPGKTPPGALAESVVRLKVAPDGTMTATDFFSPTNNAKLDQDDADLGAGAPSLLPDTFGTAGHQHLMVITGKQPTMFLLDRDNLGGVGQGAKGANATLSELTLPNGVWGHTAAFSAVSHGTTTNYLYTAPRGSHLQVDSVTPNAAKVPTLAAVAESAETFGYTSGSPVVTSDGTDPDTALVWVMQCDANPCNDAHLLAYDAVPVANSDGKGKTLHLRYTASIGAIDKFVQPLTYGGRVYVATKNGAILAFGHPTTSAVTAAPLDFGPQPVTTPPTSVTETVTLRANKKVTISSLSTTAPFTVTTVDKTVDFGDTLTVPVTYTPRAAGAAAGELHVTTTTDGNFDVDLHGVGTEDGLSANPSPVDFGQVPTGASKQAGITIANTGTNTATVTAAGLEPAAGSHFTISGLPASGQTIPAQGSLTLLATFEDANAGTDKATLTVTSDPGGNRLTIPLTADSISGSAHLSLSPTTLNFGTVAVGQTAKRTFTITNTGTVVLTINKAAPPAPPFTVADPVGEGQQLQPDDSITQTVTVAPTTTQPRAGVFLITGSDGQGAQKVTVKVNAAAPTGEIMSGVGTCLDIVRSNQANGTLADSYACNHSAAQTFTRPGGETLRVLGKCLDVRRSGTKVGTPVQLYTCNSSGAQNWDWRADQQLRNLQSGLCLTIPGSTEVSGTVLQLGACKAAAGQKWDLSAAERNRGQVLNPDGLCLDNRSSHTGDHNPIQQYACNRSPAQVVTYPGNGTVQVQGKCVDVTDSGTAPGSLVQLYDCNGSGAQQWTQGSNGELVNTHSSLCLTAPAPSTKSAQRLDIEKCVASSTAQKWPMPVS